MAGLSINGVTLDTGALLALERNRRDMVKLVAGARELHRRPLVPANVLAEWWRGRTDRRAYVRNLLVIQDVNEEIAKLAGVRRRRGQRGDRGCDGDGDGGSLRAEPLHGRL